jgi:hypothetical protein
MTPEIARDSVHLFAPRPALLAGGPSAPTTTAGRNPPQGANVYALLAKAPDSAQTVKLEILDAAGKVLRTYTRTPSGGAVPAAPAAPNAGPGAASRTALKLEAGLNAFQWDLRAEPPTTLPGNINVWGGTTTGYRVAPGRYQVRLTVGSAVQTQPLEVRQDPRVQSSPAEVASRDSLTRALNARIGEIHDALLRIRDVKEQVSRFVDRAKDAPNAAAIQAKGKQIASTVDSLEPKFSTKAANGQDVINYRNGINAQYAFLLGNVEANDVVTQPSRERYAELERLWATLRGQADQIVQVEIAAFNKLLAEGGVGGVIVPQAKPKVAM